MFWILTASVPGDDRVFTIASKAEFTEHSPWTARGASPVLQQGQSSSPLAASMSLHWFIPRMVGHLPLPIRLLPENVQEDAFV